MPSFELFGNWIRSPQELWALIAVLRNSCMVIRLILSFHWLKSFYMQPSRYRNYLWVSFGRSSAVRCSWNYLLNWIFEKIKRHAKSRKITQRKQSELPFECEYTAKVISKNQTRSGCCFRPPCSPATRAANVGLDFLSSPTLALTEASLRKANGSKLTLISLINKLSDHGQKYLSLNWLNSESKIPTD